MDEQQKKWTKTRCDELRKFFETYPNPSDEDYENIAGHIAFVVSLAKGNKEVRSALFDVLEEFDRSVRKCTA